MNEELFYATAALYAMQGIQEVNGKLGIVAELVPEQVAQHAFDFADCMLKEYRKRKKKLPFKK